MIVVCEPLCRGAEHERLNCGYLYAISKSYPGEKLIFYSQLTHFESVRSTQVQDRAIVEGLEHRRLELPGSGGEKAIRKFEKEFDRVLSDAITLGVDKVYFLSFSAESLAALNSLKERGRFAHMKFALVMHSLMEGLASKSARQRVVGLPLSDFPARPLAWRLRSFVTSNSWAKLRRGLALSREEAAPDLLSVMSKGHGGDYKYVALAEHVTRNLREHLAPDRFSLSTVTTPVVMAPIRPAPMNEYAKFVAYGSADQLMLRNVAIALLKRRPRKRYELKLVSRSSFGVADLPNVVRIDRGGALLDRSQMEKSAADADFFLFLNDPSRGRLFCSGVVFEAFSLVKPLIHFGNDCIAQYESIDAPIGIRCATFADCVDKLVDIIENHPNHQTDIVQFRNNIALLRTRLESEDVSGQIKLSFEW